MTFVRGALRHDSLLWRRLARFGAARGPAWFVEYSPALIGACAAALLPKSRRAVSANLRRIRGPVGKLQDARDVLGTFATYAGCLAESLSSGSKNARMPDLELVGRSHMEAALALGRGVVVVTAHTAGWELALPVIRAHKGMDVVMVMQPERDEDARELHDDARRAAGMHVAHVGRDPLDALPLLRRLREGAVVALQLDRVPPGMRQMPVRMFGATRTIPEGPLRLAQLSGAPIVPTFSARLGFRSYRSEMFEPVHVPRKADHAFLAEAAQRLADTMAGFVERHPTQWFAFDER